LRRRQEFWAEFQLYAVVALGIIAIVYVCVMAFLGRM
jgi:hypothetical protein